MSLEPKDFPQTWQKPSSDELLQTLSKLELKPRIWGHKRRRSEIVHEQEATAYFRREVATYLSSIVKSGLSWIDDEDERDAIWSEASRRLAERCGRTGRSPLIPDSGENELTQLSHGRDYTFLAFQRERA